MTARTATAAATTTQIVPFGSRSISTTAIANPAAMTDTRREDRLRIAAAHRHGLIGARLVRCASLVRRRSPSAAVGETTQRLDVLRPTGARLSRSAPKSTIDGAPTVAARWLIPESLPR